MTKRVMKLFTDVAVALNALIEDNRRRGLGADVNWAAIHYASKVLKRVDALVEEEEGE